jgi:hypothetical protein
MRFSTFAPLQTPEGNTQKSESSVSEDEVKPDQTSQFEPSQEDTVAKKVSPEVRGFLVRLPLDDTANAKDRITYQKR